MKKKKIALENVELKGKQRNILIEGCHIKEIGTTERSADQKIDCSRLWVFPGIIDPHVHMRDLHQAYKEDWISGSKAAIRGGVTTVFDMPNNQPPIINLENLELKRKAAEKSLINKYFYLGATNKNCEELQRILDEEPEDVIGIKVFLSGSSSNEILDNVKELRKIFKTGLDYKKVITVHTELQKFIAPRYKYPQKIENHNIIRSRKAAITGLEICLTLSRSIGNKLYIAHVSTAEEMDMIKHEKAIGREVYCEITPHHLLLDESICPLMGNYAKVNPPLRTKEDCDALWHGINEYIADTIGSDHAPHHMKEKNSAYSTALSGFPGLETSLPLLLTCVNEGKLHKERLIDLLNRKTAYIFGLDHLKGIQEGKPANLTIINPEMEENINAFYNKSKAKYTPFLGRATKGQPLYTIINGNLYVCDERRIKE